MKYNNNNNNNNNNYGPMVRKPVRGYAFYEGAIRHSLDFLSGIFHISNLINNKRPIDGKAYITVDEDADTMTIQSLFDKYNDYVIPRVSVVSLDDKLLAVYRKEIEYLIDTVNRIGKYYGGATFEAFIFTPKVQDGQFSISVIARDPYTKLLHQKIHMTTLERLSRANNITSTVHDIFGDIRDTLMGYINRNKAKSMSSGGDFDGDVLYKEYLDKEMAKLQLNSMYGLHGGDIPAEVEFTNRVKGFGASTYKLFGVPESMVDTKESTAAYEHAMDAISSTFDKYRGGFMKDYTSMYDKAIKKVIFNDPATVVMWNDGTKTVVKKHGDVEFNGEAAVMYAYVLRWHFNNNRKSMRIWLKQNAKRFEWQSEEPKKIAVTRTSKGKITKASQKEIYEAMSQEQKEVVDAIIQDAVKEFKEGVKNEDK